MPSRCISWIKSFFNDRILKTLKPSSTLNQVKVKSRQFFSRCPHTKCKNFSAFFQDLVRFDAIRNISFVIWILCYTLLHKKWSFQLSFSSKNVTKSAVTVTADRIWSHILKISLMEDFTFLCSGLNTSIIHKFLLKTLLIKESCNINTRHEIWSG